MNRDLILVRGIPGSGKTTFAELMAAYPLQYDYDADGKFKYPVFAADDYFMKDGESNFEKIFGMEKT